MIALAVECCIFADVWANSEYVTARADNIRPYKRFGKCLPQKYIAVIRSYRGLQFPLFCAKVGGGDEL